MASSVTFSVLGPLDVTAGGVPVNLGGIRSQRVLAVLLLRANQTVPLQDLVSSVWEDDPPRTAEHQVRKIVSDLRLRIPGGAAFLRTSVAGYRAAVADGQLDLRLFEQCLDEARAARASGDVRREAERLTTALRPWRGTPLEGLDLPALRSLVAALLERRLAARERLMELWIEFGEAHEAVEQLTTMSGEHPLREHLHALLMQALAACGRQAEAIEVFHRLRRLLTQKLGIEPGPEVRRRYRQIVESGAGHVTAAPPVPSVAPAAPATLPYDIPDFIGRKRELDALMNTVSRTGDTALTIITLDGMAGVGKTALAVHAAHRLADRYPDGRLFIDLGGFSTDGRDPVQPFDALGRLLRALGLPAEQVPHALADRIALWRTHTASRRLLLVLDNAANAGQVEPLLPGGGRCCVLVTSRAQPADLDGSVPVSLHPLAPDEGLALLAALLGTARTAAEEQSARQVVALCDGLPLAIRVAAAPLRRRPHQTLEDVALRLRESDSPLDELVSGGRSVRAALTASVHALSPGQQSLYWNLGICTGPDFDVYTAAALAALPPETAGRHLEAMLDLHLLVQPRPYRYAFRGLHRALVRAAAPECPAAAPEPLRLLEYYLTTAQRAARHFGRTCPPAIRGSSPMARPALRHTADALAWFDTEHPNLLASLELAEAIDHQRYRAVLPLTLLPYLRVRGHHDEELRLLRVSSRAARRLGDARLEHLVLTCLRAYH
ncbi:BTAD domain-containing putative transcriptional regulator [Streptomyces sp. YIM 98790]|uniref:AfsR/SARP family transcriptional regulator n=1 Tax=Streptomyces sp. YIM 98790 TaxID=2689077 RepID=UPI001A9F4112|nr:BTAD domain-containing putative transcriptional regulator [Streptomyces sp. YIM 98790]